jgi:hypothetical protein
VDDEEGLVLEPRDILKAFELAGPYATGKSNTAKLENRWLLALGIIDRALMELDRGLRLLELTNKVAELEAENDRLRKGGGGTIIVSGPYGLG